jgi:hypothetical protein
MSAILREKSRELFFFSPSCNELAANAAPLAL